MLSCQFTSAEHKHGLTLPAKNETIVSHQSTKSKAAEENQPAVIYQQFVIYFSAHNHVLLAR